MTISRTKKLVGATAAAGLLVALAGCGSAPEDDTTDTARNRLNTYYEQTAPLVSYYTEKGDLVSIDGMQSPEEVYTLLRNALPN